MARMIDCPYCGKLTDPNLSNCPHCGGSMAQKQVAPKRANVGKGRQSCPSCRAVVNDGDIICTACGTNLLTGQVLRDEPEPQATREPIEFSPRVIGAVAGVLVVVLLLGAWVFVSTRDPKATARRLVEEGSEIRAMEVLQDYLNQSPDDAQAQIMLGELQYRSGQYSTAASSFDRAAQVNPANVQAALWAVGAATRAGGDNDYSMRESMITRAASNAPNEPQLWYLLAAIRGAKGDFEGQANALERFLSADGDERDYEWNRAIMNARQGNLQTAKTGFEDAGIGARRADADVAVAMIASLNDNDELARALLERVQDDENLTLRQHAQAQLGKILIARGEFSEALPYLDAAVAANSTSSATRFYRGLANEGLDRQSAALADFETLVNRGREFAYEASIEMARILLRQKEPERAQDVLARAQRYGTATPDFHTLTGRAFAMTGRNADAYRSFDQALRMNAEHAPAFLERGLLRVADGQVEQGVRDLESYAKLIRGDDRGTAQRDILELITQLRRAVQEEQAGITAISSRSVQ